MSEAPNLSAWGYALARLAAAIAAGVALGLFVGDLWAGLAGTLAIYLAFQLYSLWRLDYWLRNRNRTDPPDAGGLWGDLVAQVVRLHRRKQYHKKRLIEIFRDLRRSIAAMPDGVVVLGAQQEILWFNRRASELLGLRRKLDYGLRIGSLLRQPEFHRYLARDEVHSQPITVRIERPLERYLSLQPVPYGAGQRLLIVRDVTRQIRLEEMRRDFVANASHELRSPLTVICGYLETLAAEPHLDPALVEQVQEMQRQARRMTGIVSDLLELSRLESLEGEAAGDHIDMAALAAQLHKDAMARSGPHAAVIAEIESQQGLRGDPEMIHSALWNLIDNASKYTPPSGTVTLSWRVDRAGGHFSVRDTGIGIPSQHIPRLTERFYRVDPGRARATGGSGLGLAIVKHVLQRHGASLEVVSEEGRGSEFICHFPPQRIAQEPVRELAHGARFEVGL
jgi:two-component system phosphate regulon sensor histidine kinase PhoR